jgi:hypothetical protein
LSDGGGHWRHADFVAIDLVCAWYLLHRPRWFVWVFGLLTVETPLRSWRTCLDVMAHGTAAGLAFIRGADCSSSDACFIDSRLASAWVICLASAPFLCGWGGWVGVFFLVTR